MKRYLPFLIAVLIGSPSLYARSGTALTGSGAPTVQDRGQYQNQQDDQNRGYDQRDRDDRWRRDRDRFGDNDRRAVREWYWQHRDRPPMGFRDRDRRLEFEPRFQPGFVFDWQMRRNARPVPYELVQRLAPPPPGYRYVVIGGHICLIDSGYRIHDVIHLEFNY